MQLLFAILMSTVILLCLVSGHSLTALAAVISLITLIPIVVRREKLDLFSPWNYMFYYVLLNVLFRLFFVDFEITGGVSDLNIFYLNKPTAFMTTSAGIMLLGFSFLTIGYMLPRSRSTLLDFRIFRWHSFNAGRFNTAIVTMLTLSAISFVAFVYLTFGGFDQFALTLLSSHRGLSNNLTEYRAHGYLRLLIGLSNIVAYLAYIRLRTTTQDRGFNRTALTIAILISVAMAFYSQSRAALVFVFLNIIFIKYYIERQKFPWTVFATFIPVVVVLFLFTSSLRAGSGVDLSSRITPMAVIAPILLNNGGMDASKTGHIVDYMDRTQEYQLGRTLVQFVWAAVPRELWVSKPASLDTFIGEKIYGAQTYGAAAVPPGFFGEMYMNYWYAGIIVGALVLGMLMKRIRNILDGNKNSPNFILCYVIFLQSFGMSILSSGVSSTIMGTLMSGVPLVLALYFVTSKVPSAHNEERALNQAKRVAVSISG